MFRGSDIQGRRFARFQGSMVPRFGGWVVRGPLDLVLRGGFNGRSGQILNQDWMGRCNARLFDVPGALSIVSFAKVKKQYV